VPAPAVIVFTAYASPELALPAILAGADALVGKGIGARDLFAAIRLVNRSQRLIEPPSATVLRDLSTRIPQDDIAAIGMLDGASETDVAITLNVDPRDVRHTVQRTLRALRLDVPAPDTH
jgi:DNA-binding NarL/FixJ family response regulator